MIFFVGSVANVALLPDPKSVRQRYYSLVQEFNSAGQQETNSTRTQLYHRLQRTRCGHTHDVTDEPRLRLRAFPLSDLKTPWNHTFCRFGSVANPAAVIKPFFHCWPESKLHLQMFCFHCKSFALPVESVSN